jgi:hypothetical protein
MSGSTLSCRGIHKKQSPRGGSALSIICIYVLFALTMEDFSPEIKKKHEPAPRDIQAGDGGSRF